MKNNKIYIFLIIFNFLLLFFIFLSFTFYNLKSYSIFPNYNEFSLYSYTDVEENGKSEILDFIHNKNNIILKYKLNESDISPFTGLGMNYKNLEGFDITKYDYFKIKMKSSRIQEIRVDTLFFLETYTELENYDSYIYKSIECPINDQYKTYKIYIDHLLIPEWWLEINENYNTDNNEQLDNFFALELSDETETFFNKINTIFIKKIYLENSFYLVCYYISLSFLCVLLIIIIIFIIIIIKKGIMKKYFNKVIKRISVKKNKDIEAEKIFIYINKNYTNFDISIEKVNYETGVSKHKISQLIYDYHKMFFKEYINYLRINEAKRLIIDTDWQITEIAYKIGYNNITHFGRIFRKSTGFSPKEYKKHNIK